MRYRSNRLMQARALELLALTMLGDSVLALLAPRRHVQLWRQGPRPWRGAADYFLERPALTRALGLGGVALALWLAHRQMPR